MAKAGFYAVARGRQTGVYMTWDECDAQVKGYAGAKFKKFRSQAEAEQFVAEGMGVQVDRGAGPSKNNLIIGATSAGWKREAEEGPEAAAKVPQRMPRRVEEIPPFSSTLPVQTMKDGVRVIDVYTDGASSSNGRAEARAGWGVHFPEGRNPDSDLHGLDESARLGGPLQTNNRAELMAIIRAIQLNPDPTAQLCIHTDSKYSIQCLTEWQFAWRRKGWVRGPKQTDVMNRDLIRLCETEMRRCKHRPILKHVKGHANNPGNIEADRLAVQGAALPDVPKAEWQELEPPPSDEESDPTIQQAVGFWQRAGLTKPDAEKKARGGQTE